MTHLKKQKKHTEKHDKCENDNSANNNYEKEKTKKWQVWIRNK